MPKISDLELKTRFGLSTAVKGKESLPIERAEITTSSRRHPAPATLVIWCPHCGASRKDPAQLSLGNPANRCHQCGARFR